jgi:glutathione S-transferase
MPELKLYYFQPGAKALISRLVLAVANVDYEFVQVERSQWKELKPTFVFGQLPVLSIDGQKFGQSLAIQAYLAREYGLYGSNNIESLQIDQIVQLREDFGGEVRRGGGGPDRDRDPVKQAERESNLIANVYPRYLGYFNKILQDNGTGYAVGNKLSLADFVFYEISTHLTESKAHLLQEFPEIRALKDKLEQIPAVQAALAVGRTHTHAR